ncbi:hypothetical protein D3C83_78500 [compost metagenome]
MYLAESHAMARKKRHPVQRTSAGMPPAKNSTAIGITRKICSWYTCRTLKLTMRYTAMTAAAARRMRRCARTRASGAPERSTIAAAKYAVNM